MKMKPFFDLPVFLGYDLKVGAPWTLNEDNTQN